MPEELEDVLHLFPPRAMVERSVQRLRRGEGGDRFLAGF